VEVDRSVVDRVDRSIGSIDLRRSIDPDLDLDLDLDRTPRGDRARAARGVCINPRRP